MLDANSMAAGADSGCERVPPPATGGRRGSILYPTGAASSRLERRRMGVIEPGRSNHAFGQGVSTPPHHIDDEREEL